MGQRFEPTGENFEFVQGRSSLPRNPGVFTTPPLDPVAGDILVDQNGEKTTLYISVNQQTAPYLRTGEFRPQAWVPLQASVGSDPVASYGVRLWEEDVPYNYSDVVLVSDGANGFVMWAATTDVGASATPPTAQSHDGWSPVGSYSLGDGSPVTEAPTEPPTLQAGFFWWDTDAEDYPSPGGGASTIEYLFGGAVTGVDPGPGNIRISGTGNNPRVLAISETDADGERRNFAVLKAGDTIVITDDPDQPPITGFARFLLIADPVNEGAWWSAQALRTDTVGVATPPAVGTRLRLTAHLTDGAGGGAGVTEAPTLPPDLPPGSFWWDTDCTDNVEVIDAADLFVLKAGDTMTGELIAPTVRATDDVAFIVAKNGGRIVNVEGDSGVQFDNNGNELRLFTRAGGAVVVDTPWFAVRDLGLSDLFTVATEAVMRVLLTCTQGANSNRRGSWTSAAFFAEVGWGSGASGDAAIAFHPGGVGPEWRTVPNNNIIFGRVQGTNTPISVHGALVNESTIAAKQDVVSLADLPQPFTTMEMVRRLRPVFFRWNEADSLGEIHPTREAYEQWECDNEERRERGAATEPLPRTADVHRLAEWERGSVGFIAEEVHEVCPEAVACVDGAPAGIKVDAIPALLTLAMQQLLDRVDALTAEVAELRARLTP